MTNIYKKKNYKNENGAVIMCNTVIFNYLNWFKWL